MAYPDIDTSSPQIKPPAHTSGPWHRDGFNLAAIIRCVVPKGRADARHLSGDYETIARCEGDNWDANSRLIETAPELLEALVGVVRIVEAFKVSTQLGRSQTERLEKAKAAIAKATRAA